MGNKNTNNLFKTIMAIVKKIDFSKMSNASICNILFSAIIALVIVLLSITPILSHVENIVISVGNIFITIFTDKEILASQSTSGSLDIMNAVALLILEMLICKIYCARARKN